MKRPKTGMTARIRKHISKIEGPFSACVAARELGIPIMRFYRVLRVMRDRGELVKVPRKPGWYEHKKIDLNKKPSVIKPRVLKAMYVKIRFTVGEVAMLADTYPELVRDLVYRLVRRGEVETIGKQKTPGNRWATVYRIRDRDKFFLGHICPPKGGDHNGEN